MPDAPDNVVMYFNVDNIAQEVNETLTLALTPIDGLALPSGDGVFFRNNITIVIIDNDSKLRRVINDILRLIDSL